MITSLLKTFLLSLPMSMGGLCNSGNSYVHNAYDRRNVATIKNDFAYEQDITPIQNDSAYVFKSKQISNLFVNVPSYVDFVHNNYLFAFDFYTYDNEGNTHDYHGMHIYRSLSGWLCYFFTETPLGYENETENLFFRYVNGVFNRGHDNPSWDSQPEFDSIFVRVANINNNPLLDQDLNDMTPIINDWSAFNYLFKTGLSTFTFNEDFNYNAPFGTDTSSTFVYSATNWTTSGSIEQVYKTLYNECFISVGQVYTQLRLKYLAGWGNNYQQEDGTISMCYSNNVGIFYCMEYVPYDYDPLHNDNSFYVCTRVQKTLSSGNDSSQYIVNHVLWASVESQTIEFLNDVDQESLAAFYQCNSGVGYLDTYYDIGLGNAFVLMKKTFLGFLPLFNVYILPGLSIGLLLFMPLLMSIVVLVFKAVKK